MSSLQTTCVLLSPLRHFLLVWPTRLMKNVRHDCLLNPTHPCLWPHQPWPSRRNQFPAFYLVYFGCYGEGLVFPFFFCLFTNCFPWPSCYLLFQCLPVRSWMGFKDGAVWGPLGGFVFPHFRPAGLSQLGPIMHIPGKQWPASQLCRKQNLQLSRK